MAAQTPVLHRIWSSPCQSGMAAIEGALASAESGKHKSGDLASVAINMQQIVALYDENEELDKNELHALALMVREVAEALYAMIEQIPEATALRPVLEEIECTGEDLALSSRYAELPLLAVEVVLAHW